jgi:predicted AlkP superfamily pyrophosphatase or phosphodiesterase
VTTVKRCIRPFPLATLLHCAFVLSLFLGAFAVFAQDAPQQPTHVLVISLDGARPDAILQADTRNIQALAARGAVDWEALTVLPSVTLPAHTSMLTGLSVAQHDVDYNGTQPGCPVLEFPTLLTVAEEAGNRTALVTGKEKLCLYRQADTLDYTFAREGDRSVVDRVLELLDADFTVIFAYFPNPDFFGHSTGWMSDTYLNELHNTDFQVGRILEKLDELGLSGETLIILTADHGGHDFGHGSDSPEDQHIPWIIAGPGVLPGTALDDVRVMDTAPTVLWALGLPLPDNLSGLPIYAAFDLPTLESTPEASQP